MFGYCRRLLCTLGFLVQLPLVFGQSPTGFKYLGSAQGLSNSSVKCIFQDRRGVLWFGTYDGLNRYDGYNFNVYRNRIDDSTSIPHNYICAIQEDLSNNLWVGTGQGLVQYRSITNAFTPSFYRDPHTAQKIKITSYITDIKVDRKGNVFLGTGDKGVLMIPHGQTEAKQLAFNQKDGRTIYNAAIPGITVDKKVGYGCFLRVMACSGTIISWRVWNL